MSYTDRRNWLITYDIADPRRLQRVHRYLKPRAIPVQYSAFVLHGNQVMLQRVLAGLAQLIENAEDDVRAYHLPDRCEVSMLGLQSLPDGIAIGAPTLDRLLRQVHYIEAANVIDIPDE